MFIDVARAPFIFLRSGVASDEPLESQLERLLGMNTPFVLISDYSPTDRDEETAEERKRRALFFKTVKEKMRRLCRGMIVIEGHKPTPGAVRLALAAASKAFGYTIGFVQDERAAVARATQLLDGMATR